MATRSTIRLTYCDRGQELDVQILKVDRVAKRIGVGLKQLQPEPWAEIGERVKVNDRISGKVVRIMDYGAFVEVIPGIEGLVHVSDMSYARRVRHPSDVVSVGDVVEVMILDIKRKQKRISLGLKQALGDPWEKIGGLHPAGSAVTGTVRKITSFGAFVEIVEGVTGPPPPPPPLHIFRHHFGTASQQPRRKCCEKGKRSGSRSWKSILAASV